jgi:hypothetical protein
VFTHLGYPIAHESLILRIRNLKLIQVELYKVVHELEIEGVFENLNEYAYQYRDLNLYFLYKHANRDMNEILKIYGLDKPELQLDFCVRKYILFWDVWYYSPGDANTTQLSLLLKSQLLSKLNEPTELLAFLASVLLKTSTQGFPLITALTHRVQLNTPFNLH